MKAILFLTIILSGCGGFPTLSNLSKEYKIKSDDSFIIIGIDPQYRIGVQAGNYDGDLWRRSYKFPLALNIFPEKGYIVAKLSPLKGNGAYAIDQILPKGIGGLESYVPCNKNKTLTFNTVTEKTIYLGDISIQKGHKKVSFEFSSNFDKAKSFIESDYPQLASTIIEGKTKILATAEKCKSTTLYITIPRY